MNILLAGEGGQGVQTIAETLAYAATLAGFKASYLPEFGVEQRGTPSIAYVIIEEKSFDAYKFQTADLVVILRERAIKPASDKINPNTKVVFDSSTIGFTDLPKNHGQLLAIPATQIAKEKLTSKVFNVIVLGAISRLVFDLKESDLWSALKKSLGVKFSKNPDLKELNRQALNIGYGFIFERKSFSSPIYRSKSEMMVNKSHGKIATVDPSECKGCGVCIEKCPVKCISFSETIGFFGNPVTQVDTEACILCGNCSVFCPDTAIRVEKYQD